MRVLSRMLCVLLLSPLGALAAEATCESTVGAWHAADGSRVVHFRGDDDVYQVAWVFGEGMEVQGGGVSECTCEEASDRLLWSCTVLKSSNSEDLEGKLQAEWVVDGEAFEVVRINADGGRTAVTTVRRPE